MTTNRPRVPALAAVGAVALVATACGSVTQGEATDPTTGPTTPDPTATIDTPLGPRPAFTARDYDYTLRVSCFCPEAGTPVRLQVRDGQVTEAHRRDGNGQPGAGELPAFLRLTIPEVIGEALDPRVDEVTLRWPVAQAWPSSASLDPITNAVDDEIAYSISDVEISG